MTDSFPKHTCRNCIKSAEISYIFRNKLIETDKILKSQAENLTDGNLEMFLHECKKCLQTFTTFEELNNHSINNETNFCEECNLNFCTEEDLLHHTCNDNEKGGKNFRYKCKICKKKFCSLKILTKHFSKHSTTRLRATRKSKRTVKNLKHDSNDIVLIEENQSTEIIKSECENDSKSSFEIEFDDNPIETDSESDHKDETDTTARWYLILKYTCEKNKNGFFECICCDEIFKKIEELRKHTRMHNSFVCKICEKSFTILSNLRRHLRTHADVTKEINHQNNRRGALERDENIFKCIACPKSFTKRKFLSEHLKTHTDFSCMLCEAKFTFATNLRKHLRWHNRPKDEIRVWKQPPVEKRTCDICLKVFKFRPSMLKHKRKHEITGKTCKYCEQIFENSIKLYKHMEERHEDKKNIVCNVCGKKFFREWNLKTHMIVHTGVKPFMCEICGASFALGGNLASHKRLHTGIKPYKCSVCGRGFTQQAALRSHEAGHSDRRDHVCPICGAAFSRAGAMRNHRKRHETFKPFPCNMCGKRFTFSSERKRHMTIHTGEKDYVCDFCGKAFNRLTNLTVHRRIHTGEQPFHCEVCGKGFIQAHCLKTHLSTHKKMQQTVMQQMQQVQVPQQILPIAGTVTGVQQTQNVGML